MDRRELLTPGVAAAVVAASVTPANAKADNDHDLVDSWLGTATATNPLRRWPV